MRIDQLVRIGALLIFCVGVGAVGYFFAQHGQSWVQFVDLTLAAVLGSALVTFLFACVADDGEGRSGYWLVRESARGMSFVLAYFVGRAILPPGIYSDTSVLYLGGAVLGLFELPHDQAVLINQVVLLSTIGFFITAVMLKPATASR